MLEGGGFAPQAPTPQARLPVAVAPAPTQASVSSSFRELNVPADGRGQYYVDALIDGVRVPFIVDTGASFVSISADVANVSASSRRRIRRITYFRPPTVRPPVTA